MVEVIRFRDDEAHEEPAGSLDSFWINPTQPPYASKLAKMLGNYFPF